MIDTIDLPHPLIPLKTTGLTLEMVGGKALNLAKLTSAGFPVPEGFFIPTSCYKDFLRQNNLDKRIPSVLENQVFTSPEALERASAEIRLAFSSGRVKDGFKKTLERGWCWLGKGPVAVRSSATTEDLPEASFAGQQDTFLNVVGDEQILQAVVDCWSSLWSARAISYRNQNRIPQEDSAICVVVQKMVPAEASGVMFTANPLTGLRTEMVIDATLGLGEALVSGRVTPDNYIVTVNRVPSQVIDSSGFKPEPEPEINLSRVTLGGKGVAITAADGGGVALTEIDASQVQALADQAILSLARIGIVIDDLFEHPQDVEWAYVGIEGSSERLGKFHILQTRPVTTLFPLPDNLDRDIPRFLVGFHTVQGVIDPITPLGQDTLKLVFAGTGRLFGIQTSLETQTALYSAAERLWINFTPLLRSPVGHRVFPILIKEIDPGVANVVDKVSADPRFSSIHGRPRLKTIRQVFRFICPFIRQALRVLRHPERERQAVLDLFDAKVSQTLMAQSNSGALWVDLQQNVDLLLSAARLFSDFVIPRGIPPIFAGIAPFYGIVTRFSEQVSAALGDPNYLNLRLEVARGLPNNVTTEMDLALWKIAVDIKGDIQTAIRFQNDQAPDLAREYLAGTLPQTALDAVHSFLVRYGQRGLGEVDIGKARWAEDPTPVMRALQSYLKISDPERAPDVVFARGKELAEEAAETLVEAVARLPFGWFKVRLLRFAVSRFRALAGTREAPKFFAVRMMSIIRQGLLASGTALTEAGLLDSSDDLFFLRIAELIEISGSKTVSEDIKALVEIRRRTYYREMGRPRLPLVFLSDGKTFYPGFINKEAEGSVDTSTIQGSPVSPGVVEGKARVVLNPYNSGLEPGEIMVCPGTDPSWTPLFLSAGGLVMEVGGMMTHGSVVAREYGIPAVVGVFKATTRLRTGSLIRLDANSGNITLLD